MKTARWSLLLLAACAGQGEPVDPPGTGVPVTTLVTTLDSLSETLVLTGRLVPVPGGGATLAAPTDAVVQSIAVRVGDPVRAGDLLLQLDTPELRTAAATLTAQARTADLDLTRQRDLYAEGITARRQLEEREGAAASARAAAEAATELLGRARVVSPLAGGVQRVLVQVGERVAAGQPLVEVIDRRTLDLRAGATPQALTQVAIGQAASVRGEGVDDPVPGRVAAIAPGIDTLSGLGEVVVRIPAAGALRPGSGGTATVQVRLLRDAVVLPDSALVPAEGGLVVFVVGDDSLARARPVEVRLRAGGRAAVNGVQPGERVVISGAFGLADSVRVRLTEAP